MLEAAQDCIIFSKNKKLSLLENDKMLFFCFSSWIRNPVRCFYYIKNISTFTFEIQWKKIIGMRNHLIHVYLNIDYDTVWKVVSFDILM